MRQSLLRLASAVCKRIWDKAAQRVQHRASGPPDATSSPETFVAQLGPVQSWKGSLSRRILGAALAPNSATGCHTPRWSWEPSRALLNWMRHFLSGIVTLIFIALQKRVPALCYHVENFNFSWYMPEEYR